MDSATFAIYMDWLDETKVLLKRHDAQSDTVWRRVPAADLAEELRVIATSIEERAQHLRAVADAFEHLLSPEVE